MFGPAGGLPPGFARCIAGTTLLRGHSPGKAAAWFGPAVGRAGIGRFDVPERTTASDPGVCYLAPTLTGVLVERVIRDAPRPVLSLARLQRNHAVTEAILNRDIVLIDLLATPWTVHGVQVHELTAPPPYRDTQRLAFRFSQLQIDFPGSPPRWPDGIAYGSRFGAIHECIALWDRAADALDWGPGSVLGTDRSAVATACNQLGIGLIQ